MKMRNISLTVILLLSMSTLSILSTISLGETSSIGTTGGASTTPNQTIPAPIIINSDNYIKKFVGEDYLNTYMKHTDNVTMFSDGKISYIISYLYNIPDNYLERPHAKNVAVTLDKDGNIIDYLGPKRPYKFIMTREKIIGLAKENGLGGNIDAQIDRRLDSGSIDGYIWVAESDQQTDCKTIAGGNQECMIPGIYFDIDNGSVIGKFNTSSLIRNDQGGTTTPTETPAITETPTTTETPKSPAISGLAVLIVILVSVYYRKYKN